MINQIEPVHDERLPFKAIGHYLLYCLFVQGMQTSARALALEKLASQYTVLALRFQVAFIIVAVWASAVALHKRSWAVFKPGNFWAQSGRALAQLGQSVFVILAATELGGGFQAAASLVTVPLWVVVLGWFAKKNRPKWTVWFGVLAYFLVALVLTSQGAIGKGTSITKGICYLIGSGFCTAALQVLTKKTADEHAATASFWQNGPAALVFFPLWWHTPPSWWPGPIDTAHIPTAGLAWVLVLALVVCSLTQQVFLLWANREAKAKGTTDAQLTGLRGAQVGYGMAFDSAFFHTNPTGPAFLAIPMVMAAVKVLWETGKPKKVTS